MFVNIVLFYYNCIASVKKTHVWHLTELCELFTYINEIGHVVMV